MYIYVYKQTIEIYIQIIGLKQIIYLQFFIHNFYIQVYKKLDQQKS